MDEKECIIRDCSEKPEEQGVCGDHLERINRREPVSGIFERRKADRPCIIKGCGRSSHAKDLCAMHFNRVVRGVPLNTPVRVRKDATRQCSIGNCTTTVQAKDMCGLHYSRFRKGAPLDGVKRGGKKPADGKCSLPFCSKPHSGLGYCQGHLLRYRRGGDMTTPIKEPRRIEYTHFDGTEWTSSGEPAHDGYVIFTEKGSSNPRKYMKEHRLVMENELGRKLKGDENVHHINGVRHDNRIENLELWNTSHPAGQRIQDKVEWAKDMLRRYAPESLK